MRTGANIYKRRDNRWEARVLIGRRPDGRPLYKYLYGTSYRHALQAKKDFECQRKAPVMEKSGVSISFSEAAEVWLTSNERRWKPATRNKYAVCLEKHILPEWGSLSLKDVTQERYDALISSLERALSCSSLRTVNTVIISCLKHHLKCVPLLRRNPEISKKQVTVSILSDGEAASLVSFLHDSSDLCAIGVLLTLYSGLRLGELCALRWEDIELEQQIFYVRHTLQRIQIPSAGADAPKTKLQLGLPKNSRERTVPLHPEILIRLRELQGIYAPSAYLLSGSEKPVEPRTMANRFKRILKDAGIRDIHFHALRHTFATRCVEADMNIQALSEILGHSSVKITMDRYVHLSMRYKKEQLMILQFSASNSEIISRQRFRQEEPVIPLI